MAQALHQENLVYVFTEGEYQKGYEKGGSQYWVFVRLTRKHKPGTTYQHWSASYITFRRARANRRASVLDAARDVWQQTRAGWIKEEDLLICKSRFVLKHDEYGETLDASDPANWVLSGVPNIPMNGEDAGRARAVELLKVGGVWFTPEDKVLRRLRY